MSTLAVTTIQSKTANTPPIIQESGGDEVGQFCRAWVNFNGTGTVAITNSFNVSSITDNGTGDYTINLINAMPNANYVVVLNGRGTSSVGRIFMEQHDSVLRSTTQLRIYTLNTSAAVVDTNPATAAFFGD